MVSLQGDGLINKKGTHIGSKSMKCYLCNTQFNNASNLWKHKIIHSAIKFNCDTWHNLMTQVTYQNMSQFNEPGNLSKYNRINAGEKPYHCNLCDKKFIYSHEVKIHNLSHTGQKPYECNICDK